MLTQSELIEKLLEATKEKTHGQIAKEISKKTKRKVHRHHVLEALKNKKEREYLLLDMARLYLGGRWSKATYYNQLVLKRK